jgi:hypothetical protein
MGFITHTTQLTIGAFIVEGLCFGFCVAIYLNSVEFEKQTRDTPYFNYPIYRFTDPTLWTAIVCVPVMCFILAKFFMYYCWPSHYAEIEDASIVHADYIPYFITISFVHIIIGSIGMLSWARWYQAYEGTRYSCGNLLATHSNGTLADNDAYNACWMMKDLSFGIALMQLIFGGLALALIVYTLCTATKPYYKTHLGEEMKTPEEMETLAEENYKKDKFQTVITGGGESGRLGVQFGNKIANLDSVMIAGRPTIFNEPTVGTKA